MAHPRYHGPCGWQALLTPRCPEPALDGARDCDLAVVGAGFTGLAAARAWARARPQDRVVVLESSVVGEGGAGRHAGLLTEVALADAAGAAAVERLSRFSRLLGEAMATVRHLVRERRIACQLVRVGVIRVAATPREAKHLQRCRAILEAARLPCDWLDGAALESRLGTRAYRSGLYMPDASLVQPAALIRGLADSLPDNVTLFEETPALGVRPAGGGWQIDSPRGAVRARRVLLANNGFAAALAERLRTRLMVAYTYAGLTRPLPAGIGAGAACGWALLPVSPSGAAFCRTPDRRLLVRAGRSFEREASGDAMAARLEDGLLKHFPQLSAAPPGQRFEHVWSRATGVTANGAPVWGEIAPGLLVSAGCNGGSLLKDMLLGTLLAKKALGERVPDVPALLGTPRRLPPWPIRRLGVAVMSRAPFRRGGLQA
jgi:glycine/D-amino acid oxidase-like deaminating enzyme